MKQSKLFATKDENIVLDGGLATELERQGADLTGNLWSARLLRDNPDLIYRTHRAYYEAGADTATTASYQATVKGFAALGLDSREAEDLIQSSIRIAKKARDDFWKELDEAKKDHRRFPLVAASVGCYGASLADGSEFHGNYRNEVSREQLKDFHRTRMLLLLQERPDIIACETVPCLVEVLALADLLEEPEIQAFGVPAWISVSFREDTRMASGESILDLVSALGPLANGQGWQRGGGLLVGVGINCGPPAHAEAALQALSSAAKGAPLVCYPNKGEGWDESARGWVPDTAMPDPGFAAACRSWHAAGARFIGGCCRTTPATIAAVRASLAESTPAPSPLG